MKKEMLGARTARVAMGVATLCLVVRPVVAGNSDFLPISALENPPYSVFRLGAAGAVPEAFARLPALKKGEILGFYLTGDGKIHSVQCAAEATQAVSLPTVANTLSKFAAINGMELSKSEHATSAANSRGVVATASNIQQVNTERFQTGVAAQNAVSQLAVSHLGSNATTLTASMMAAGAAGASVIAPASKSAVTNLSAGASSIAPAGQTAVTESATKTSGGAALLAVGESTGASSQSSGAAAQLGHSASPAAAAVVTTNNMSSAVNAGSGAQARSGAAMDSARGSGMTAAMQMRYGLLFGLTDAEFLARIWELEAQGYIDESDSLAALFGSEIMGTVNEAEDQWVRVVNDFDMSAGVFQFLGGLITARFRTDSPVQPEAKVSMTCGFRGYGRKEAVHHGHPFGVAVELHNQGPEPIYDFLIMSNPPENSAFFQAGESSTGYAVNYVPNANAVVTRGFVPLNAGKSFRSFYLASAEPWWLGITRSRQGK